MAAYPNIPKNRGVRSTTVVQPNQSNAAGAVVLTGAIGSKARTTAARSIINAKDAADPSRLVKIINQMQGDLQASTQAQRSNPYATPYLVRGLTIAGGATSGATFYPAQLAIPHMLKRNYSEWQPSRVQTAGPLMLSEASGATTLAVYPADQFLVLTNGSTLPVYFNVTIAGD